MKLTTSRTSRTFRPLLLVAYSLFLVIALIAVTSKQSVQAQAGAAATMEATNAEAAATDSAMNSTAAPTSAPLTTSLYQLAAKHDILVGAAVRNVLLKSAPKYAEIVNRDFNLLVPENAAKMAYTHPEQDKYYFDEVDELVAYAEAHHMAVRGHTLIWHQQAAGWIVAMAEHSTRDEMLKQMETYIKTVVGHYKGKMKFWDVVNEAVDENGTLRKSFWLKSIGPDYIDYAFRYAHEADPDALLFYNDYGAEGIGTKSNAIYKLVQDMVSRGVPINGVGLQMHIGVGSEPPSTLIAKNMERIAKLGLDVHITELDVKIQDAPASDTDSQKLEAQAAVYSRIANICIKQPACKVFTLWGFGDSYSWIPGFTHKADAPLIYDKKLEPKPAYTALIEAFSGSK